MPARSLRRKLKGEARRFVSDQSATTAVLFALMTVPMLGIMGLAVDRVHGSSVHSALQSKLDAAVLAGAGTAARGDGTTPATAAKQFYDGSKAIDPSEQATFKEDGEILRGKASADVPTTFSRLFGQNTIKVEVQSAGTSAEIREPVCFMAMHPTRKHTLELDGAVSVIGPDCNIYGNSNHPDDVVDPHKSENYLTGRSVQAMGYGHNYLQNVSPPLEYAPELIPDPLSSWVIPTPGACDYNNTIVSSATKTLNPGVYCNGLKIKSGAKVTLSPGVYFISGADFNIASSTVTGDGVTIVLAGSKAELDWSQATVRLTAPTSGATKSIVLTGDRISRAGEFAASTIDLTGVVYLPQMELTWDNAGSPTINAKWTVWIVDGVSWDGDGTIRLNFDIASGGVPYPEELRNVIPRPGHVRLVQ